MPGRICLMGEHSDWAGSYRRFNQNITPGMCLVSGTNQGVYARVRRHPNKLIVMSQDHTGKQFPTVEVDMNPEALLEMARSGSPLAYIAGVAYQVIIRYQVQGMELDNYLTDLPVRKGLSSSAAICVLTARAFNRLYDLKMTVRGEMDLGYMGEITTPSECGRMDQCCAFGARPVLMRFSGDQLECEELSLGGPVNLVIVELQGQKDTVEILQKLNKCYPVADDEQQQGLQDLLGPINKRIVESAIESLAAGDMKRTGELMEEFQAAFDKYAMPVCPSQLTSPKLHQVLKHEPLRPHIWGCKGVGSQGDGCAQLLCKSADDMEKAIEIITRDFGMPCMPLQIGSTRPVTQAVIPAASFPQLLYPAASKTLPPSLFPILDSDGILKPAILLLVEEALEAGLEKVVIVVAPAHEVAFRDIFHKQPDIKDFNKMPSKLQQYAHKIHEMGQKVEIVVQKEQQGLGHAVLIAKPALKANEPFLIMLGDHLYKMTGDSLTPCVQQLLSAYSGTSIMAVRRTPEDLISNFGCATGKFDIKPGESSSQRLTLTSLVEKPTKDYARRNLGIPGLARKEYLTAFGLYIVTEHKLFSMLEEQLEHQGPNSGPLQLTSVLDQLRQEYGMQGYIIDGERFDIGGQPSTYLETLNSLARSTLEREESERAMYEPGAFKPSSTTEQPKTAISLKDGVAKMNMQQLLGLGVALLAIAAVIGSRRKM